MAANEPNMQAFMEQAKEMQKQMQEMQERLTGMIVVGSAGGNLVKVHMNCAHRFVRVEISPTLFSKDEDMLEDLIVAAGNDAEQKVEDTIKMQMIEMAKRMKLSEGTSDLEDGSGEGGAIVGGSSGTGKVGGAAGSGAFKGLGGFGTPMDKSGRSK